MEYKSEWEITRLGQSIMMSTQTMLASALDIQFMKFILQQERITKDRLDQLISN